MKLNGLENYFKTGKNGEIVDFKQVNKNGCSPLMYAFAFNKSPDLNLNYAKFDYLKKNSAVKKKNKSGNLNLTTEQLDYLIKNSDLKQINYYGDIHH